MANENEINQAISNLPASEEEREAIQRAAEATTRLTVDAENPLYQQGMDGLGYSPKILPESELELNYYFTNPQWGDVSVSPELQAMFKRKVVSKIPRGVMFKDGDGQEFVSDGSVKLPEEKNYWAQLAWLTRDLRLANYDKATYSFCAYYYELAGALLNEGYYRAAALSMQIGAIHGEMSQGRGGFLRTMQNTLIKKEEIQTMEVKKNNILQGKPKDDQRYY
jgi:hypothetical protein